MKLPVLTATAVVALLALASPALAVEDDTALTATVTADELTLTVPTDTDLGSAAPGGTLGTEIGLVRVDDLRAAVEATWLVTVSVTDLTTGGASGAETIPKGAVTYWSGGASLDGEGNFVPGQETADDAVALDLGRTAFSKTSGAGSNYAQWNPTVSVAVPAGAVAGAYQATLTHSLV